jgi:hypothetical protein
MHELISHLGVRFYLFELNGSLKYTLTRRGQAPKLYEICESDVEDGRSSDSSSTDETKSIKAGIDASAVGIQLRLIKNDGVLEIDFEGKNGSTARWTFSGVEMSGGTLVATASTQTDIVPNEYLMCGEDKRKIAKMKHKETQTATAFTHTTGVQTVEPMTTNTGVQTTPRQAPLCPQIPQTINIPGSFINTPLEKILLEVAQESLEARGPILDRYATTRRVYDLLKETFAPCAEAKTKTKESRLLNGACKSTLLTSTSNETSSESDTAGRLLPSHSPFVNDPKTKKDLKRKASTSLEGTKPLHKRAKSKHDSEIWPRHIYMECFRITPIFKGDVGVLHIDLEEAAVWFEGWYGKENMRVYERKQFNLSDVTSKKPHPKFGLYLTATSQSDLQAVPTNSRR